MDLNDLLNGHAEELPKGTPTLTPAEVGVRMPLVPGWALEDDGKTIRFAERMADFQAVLDFVNQVGALAEEQQHHPDILIHGYRNVRLDFSTHSIGGLSDNDFIMAAKINQMRQ